MPSFPIAAIILIMAQIGRFYPLRNLYRRHKATLDALAILKYIGPGFLVTVGFIDPGNWVADVAAGSRYGYELLWVITLSTLMLIVLQHNAAHLGIATGLCLSEASSIYAGKTVSRLFLASAVLASISTALAEVLGAAIGLNMLFGLHIMVGAALSSLFAIYMLFSNGYRNIERWIIGLVSLVGVSFLFQLGLVNIGWTDALKATFVPLIPHGSVPVVLGALGAVVMPHNLFLHSEIIQSRQWNTKGESAIKKQLRFEFTDTLFAMILGWAINCAIIMMAASVFFSRSIYVAQLTQAREIMRPLLGNASAFVFGAALLLSGVSSSVTAGMAGGSIFAGLFKEPYNHRDPHTRAGILITIVGAVFVILFIRDAFTGILWSQIALGLQLPFTIVMLVILTSSRRIMGRFSNRPATTALLWAIAAAITVINIVLIV